MKKILFLLVFFVSINHLINAQTKPINVSIAPIRSWITASSTSNVDSITTTTYRVLFSINDLNLSGSEEFIIKLTSNDFSIEKIAERPASSISMQFPIFNPSSAVFATIKNVSSQQFTIKLNKAMLAVVGGMGHFTFTVQSNQTTTPSINFPIMVNRVSINEKDSAIAFDLNSQIKK